VLDHESVSCKTPEQTLTDSDRYDYTIRVSINDGGYWVTATQEFWHVFCLLLSSFRLGSATHAPACRCTCRQSVGTVATTQDGFCLSAVACCMAPVQSVASCCKQWAGLPFSDDSDALA
jgi:hypothetical protein